MSRTTRFKHDAHKLGHSSLLWHVHTEISIINKAVKTHHEKMILAKVRADGCKHVWISSGPMWFHREYTQAPYRAHSRDEMRKFMRNPDYELQLDSKPHKDYWD